MTGLFRSQEQLRLQKSHTRATWLSAGAAAFSVAVSIFALIVAYRLSKQEDVTVIIQPFVGYETELAESEMPEIPAVLMTYWQCLLINNGDKVVSIVSYRIKLEKGDFPANYRDMFGGLFASPDNEFLHTPLVIEAGIGLAVHPKAHKLVTQAFSHQKKLPMTRLIELLAKERIDFYGNLVEPFFEKDRLGSITLRFQNPREQLFIVTFKTARGNYFTSTASWYKVRAF